MNKSNNEYTNIYVSGIKPNEDKFDIKSVEDICDNLELFKLEMFTQLLKVQKNQTKSSVTDLMEEISEFRETFTQTIDETNRRHETDLNDMLKELRNFKRDMFLIFDAQLSKEKEYIKDLKKFMEIYYSSMNKKIKVLEDNQASIKSQISLILNDSNDKEIKKKVEKYFEFEELSNLNHKHSNDNNYMNDEKAVDEDINELNNDNLNNNSNSDSLLNQYPHPDQQNIKINPKFKINKSNR